MVGGVEVRGWASALPNAYGRRLQLLPTDGLLRNLPTYSTYGSGGGALLPATGTGVRSWSAVERRPQRDYTRSLGSQDTYHNNHMVVWSILRPKLEGQDSVDTYMNSVAYVCVEALFRVHECVYHGRKHPPTRHVIPPPLSRTHERVSECRLIKQPTRQAPLSIREESTIHFR